MQDKAELLRQAKRQVALRRQKAVTRAEQAAEQALAAVQSGLEAGMPPDAVLSDVECALAALGEISGRRVTEDVTSRIFSRFCVGK